MSSDREEDTDALRKKAPTTIANPIKRGLVPLQDLTGKERTTGRRAKSTEPVDHFIANRRHVFSHHHTPLNTLNAAGSGVVASKSSTLINENPPLTLLRGNPSNIRLPPGRLHSAHSREKPLEMEAPIVIDIGDEQEPQHVKGKVKDDVDSDDGSAFQPARFTSNRKSIEAENKAATEIKSSDYRLAPFGAAIKSSAKSIGNYFYDTAKRAINHIGIAESEDENEDLVLSETEVPSIESLVKRKAEFKSLAHSLLYPDEEEKMDYGRTSVFKIVSIRLSDHIYTMGEDAMEHICGELVFEATDLDRIKLQISGYGGKQHLDYLGLTSHRAIAFGFLSENLAYVDMWPKVEPPPALNATGIRAKALWDKEKLLNYRYLLRVKDLEERNDFVLACSRLNTGNKWNVDRREYEPQAPSGSFEKREQARLGKCNIPYSTGTAVRKSQRKVHNSFSDYANFSSPVSVGKRKRNSGPSRIDDDDGFALIQPSVPVHGELMFVYPEDQPDGIHLTSIEYARLQPGVYLNDNIIDFDMRRMYDTILTPEQRSRTSIFNCFFYKRYGAPRENRKDPVTPYDRVKSWTKDVNIFEKELLVIPICENVHWYLAVIVNPGAVVEASRLHPPDEGDDRDGDKDSEKDEGVTADQPISIDDETEDGKKPSLPGTYIVILDSLFSRRPSTVRKLKDYLISEAYARLGICLNQSFLHGCTPRTPKQDNLYDCGCFLLQYAEHIFQQIETFPRAIVQPKDLVWFEPSSAKERRGKLLKLMGEMGADYSARHPDMHKAIEIGGSSDIEEIGDVEDMTVDLS